MIVLETYNIPIPQEVKEGLLALSSRMGIRLEAVVLFSVVRYLEVQRGESVPSPLALLLKGGISIE